MRNMSFTMTKEQILAGTKTVTRRTGWLNLKPGDLICAVKKGMGLKKGEKIERLRTLRIVSVRREQLNNMLTDYLYGQFECVLEGFPFMTPGEFVGMFMRANGCAHDEFITRLEFEYA